MLGVGELWVALAPRTPSFPIRQVQVQGVDFVLGEEADLLLQFIHGHEGVSESEHQAPHAEGGPVDDVARLQFALPVRREDELLEGLKASVQPYDIGRIDGDPAGRDAQAVSFVLVEEDLGDGGDDGRADEGAPVSVGRVAVLAKETLDLILEVAPLGLEPADGASSPERLDVLRSGKELVDRCSGACARQQKTPESQE